MVYGVMELWGYGDVGYGVLEYGVCGMGCGVWGDGSMGHGDVPGTLRARIVEVCLETSSIERQYLSSSLAATSPIT